MDYGWAIILVAAEAQTYLAIRGILVGFVQVVGTVGHEFWLFVTDFGRLVQFEPEIIMKYVAQPIAHEEAFGLEDCVVIFYFIRVI